MCYLWRTAHIFEYGYKKNWIGGLFSILQLIGFGGFAIDCKVHKFWKEDIYYFFSFLNNSLHLQLYCQSRVLNTANAKEAAMVFIIVHWLYR